MEGQRGLFAGQQGLGRGGPAAKVFWISVAILNWIAHGAAVPCHVAPAYVVLHAVRACCSCGLLRLSKLISRNRTMLVGLLPPGLHPPEYGRIRRPSHCAPGSDGCRCTSNAHTVLKFAESTVTNQLTGARGAVTRGPEVSDVTASVQICRFGGAPADRSAWQVKPCLDSVSSAVGNGVPGAIRSAREFLASITDWLGLKSEDCLSIAVHPVQSGRVAPKNATTRTSESIQAPSC